MISKMTLIGEIHFQLIVWRSQVTLLNCIDASTVLDGLRKSSV
jgi:hypothetical protein